MDLGLKDKVVLVTGGAKGIGRGIVDVLAEEGAVAVIVGRNQVDNRAAVAELAARGQLAYPVTTELTDDPQCRRAVDQALSLTGRIDALVNNAGVNDGVGLAQGNYADFVASLHKNLTHYYLMAHYALPQLIEHRGSIVNITSKTAETGQGGTSGYAAANGGRNALTREWAVELLPHGVRVNAVVVAECYTPLYDRWIHRFEQPEAKRERIEQRIPLGRRMTTTRELGNAVAFLLSEQSSHTTGQLLHVDGGYVHLDRAIE